MSFQTILLVDDNADTTEMYALGLSYEGYRPVTATDAAAAEKAISDVHPSAVITDLGLPGVDGWGLIRHLKADPSTCEIPVILLTGYVDTKISAYAKALGCAAVLIKPCPPNELVEVLRHFVPTSRARRGDGDGNGIPDA